MKPSVTVFVGIAAAASMLGRSAAQADVTDVQVRINPPNAGATDLVRPALVLGDGMMRFKPHVEGTTLGSYQDTATQVLDFLNIHAEATGSQTTSITASGDTLSIHSTANISGSKTLSGVTKTDQASSASAKEIVVVDFTVSTASVYVVTGSMSRSAAGLGSAGLPDGQVVFLQEGLQADQVSFTRTGKIAAGRSGHFNIELLGGTGSGTISPPITQFTAAWTFTFDVRPEATEPGDDIRWTKPTGGTFGADANWNPQHVPVKDLEHRDNAIFDIAGGYTVDYAAAGKTKALGTAQHANRLEILAGDVTKQSANITVDELDLVRPSLTVDSAKLTLASGRITSNSATIGSLHAEDAEVRVDGPDSLWNCLGRLRIGGADTAQRMGTLTITNGADVTSHDTRIGAGVQTGAARVAGTGSTWDTDNVAVGFSSTGSLRIEDGAVVTSAIADVGSAANGVISVNVTGVDSAGTSSAWNATTLTVGQHALMDVALGAKIHATTVNVLGGVLGVGGRNVAHDRAADVECGDVTVGSSGTLLLGSGGLFGVTGGFSVGPPSRPGGDVLIDGSSAPNDAPLLFVSGQISVGGPTGGNVSVVGGGRLSCGSTVIAIVSGQSGRVRIDGAQSGWLSSGTAVVGAAAGSGGSGRVVLGHGGTFRVITGNLLIDETGSIEGDGHLIVGGELHVYGNLDVSSPEQPFTPAKTKATPVRPASTLTIEGNLVVEATGVVRVDAGGPESDHVVVTGDATLGGTLVLQFMNGYAPKAGEHFDVVQVGGQTTGDFATVDVRGLAPGAQFDTTTSGGTRTMTAVADTSPLPTVSIKPATKRAKEKSRKPISLKFSRKGDASQALTVSYVVGGTAANGLDCVTLPGTITIPARKRSAKVKLVLVDDFRDEDDETLTVTVLPGAGYTHGLASIAQVTIADDD